MKMQKSAVNSLIADLLPMLREDATEVVTHQKTSHTGAQLLAMEITHTKSGKPVVRKQTYQISTPIVKPINHGAKIRKIIKDAKSEAQMENDLAAYVAKWGKSLEAIKAHK